MADGTELPLAGIRVIEHSSGMAGDMAGLLLADYGAEVLKIERPGGEPHRAQPAFGFWNRGKQSWEVDLAAAAGRKAYLDLVSRCDVVVNALRADFLPSLGLSYESCSASNPRLIWCDVSGFGLADDASPKPYEGVVAARLGQFVGLDSMHGSALGDEPGRPIFVAAPINSYSAAQLAAQGVLAALWGRETTGHGDHVSTSLLQGACASSMRHRLGDEEMDPDAPLVEPRTLARRGVQLSFLTAQCSDGRWIQMCARQDHHFRNWLAALGLKELLNMPEYARAPLGITSLEALNRLEMLLRERMATRTLAEWMHVFTEETDVGADPFLTFAEFMNHDDMVENDRIVEVVSGPDAPLRQLGRIALLDSSPGPSPAPAPAVGSHDAPTWWPPALDSDAAGAHHAAGAHYPAAQDARSSGTGPLAGVTVLELAYFIAAPLATVLLAELGARVIKVEPLTGDPYRRTGAESLHLLHGKNSISLDLKHEQSRQILQKLMTSADVLVNGFRGDVAERLGFDPGSARAANPGLVYVQASSYGSRGPQAGRAAFHSTPNALAGGGILQAGVGNPPVDSSYPDSCSAIAVATSVLLGLWDRKRLGAARTFETTMLASTGYVLSPYLPLRDTDLPVATVDALQCGLSSVYRLYECKEGWLFVAASADREFAALCAALGRSAWATDQRFASESDRLAHDKELAELLAAQLCTESAQHWSARLAEAGVGAVQADVPRLGRYLYEHGLLTHAVSTEHGGYWKTPCKIDFARSPGRVGDAETVGSSTRQVLLDIGYSAAEIAELKAAKVVGSGS